MVKVKRFEQNPILSPNKENIWEAEAVFNGCPVKNYHTYHLVYRATSLETFPETNLKISSIGYAETNNGTHFENRRQLIKPEEDWERFGCEDPRITKIDDKYYIIYTALSEYPLRPYGIKLGLAITRDFQKIEEKHPVTNFNSKAMALFPEKINGKFAAIVTVNTDMPPAKIGIALFDEESQIWSPDYWTKWYSELDNHVLDLLKDKNDQVEAGAPPLKTDKGWLFIFCYIRDYYTQYKIFEIEAVLLDLNDPKKIIGRTKEPLLIPEKNYELFGNVPNVIFPSGALIENGLLNIYYGATDTTVCAASCDLNELLDEMLSNEDEHDKTQVFLERFEGNPIICPKPEHSWESKYTFNTGAIYLGDKIHLLYRAMGSDDTSVLGYASTKDGYNIDERLDDPVYVPRENFEQKIQPGNSGCEDPRITKIDDKLYMCYTAFDGKNPTRVALTSIKTDDFLNKNWAWEKPVLISPPDQDDKDACILPKKINDKYVIFHRSNSSIWIDFVDDLNFDGTKFIGGKVLFDPRINHWDNERIGIGDAPIETEKGWLMIYHGLSRDTKYRLGVALLDLNDPTKVISRLVYPIFVPEAEYENHGLRFGTVFTNGTVLKNGKIFVYYGAADQATCVATADLKDILDKI